MPKYFFMPSNLDEIFQDISEKDYEKIEKEIRDVIRKIAEEALNETTKKYNKYNPEIGKTSFITGKGSNQFQGKIELGYTHEDSSGIEEGEESKQITGVYVQNVKEHKRKLGQGRPKTRRARMKQAITSRLKKKPPRETRVKAHKREYKNQKLVQIKGEWRVVGKTPNRKGKRYLTTAIEKAFEQGNIAKAIEKALK